MKSMDHVSVNINIMQGNLRPVYVYEFHKAHDLSLSLSLSLSFSLPALSLIQANKIWWKKLKFDPNNL